MPPASDLLTSFSSELDFAPIFPAASPAGESAGFALFTAGDLLLGSISRPAAGATLQAVSREVYDRLFQSSSGWQLYRVWNQVPDINAGAAPGGLENYRAFSAGRSLAFEAHFGKGFTGQLPAASGVGTRQPELSVAFVAGRKGAHHFENPEQVPAYRYPSEHGPRSPSFARATAGEYAGRPLIFISGTAAIKGHRTVAPFVLDGQLECTLDNLRVIGGASGIGRDLGVGANWNRHFKVYYRRAEDRSAVTAALQHQLLQPRDEVVWRQADLCRADLLVEIEATFAAA